MEIWADKEGHAFIMQLADIALRAGGIKNYESVTKGLVSLKLIDDKEALEDDG